jgi:hypothetical protein
LQTATDLPLSPPTTICQAKYQNGHRWLHEIGDYISDKGRHSDTFDGGYIRRSRRLNFIDHLLFLGFFFAQPSSDADIKQPVRSSDSLQNHSALISEVGTMALLYLTPPSMLF